jgi:CcmD family protein
MLTFLIAYLVLWLGVLGYVLRLAAAQRRLQRAMLALQRRLEASEEAQDEPVSKAA